MQEYQERLDYKLDEVDKNLLLEQAEYLAGRYEVDFHRTYAVLERIASWAGQRYFLQVSEENGRYVKRWPPTVLRLNLESALSSMQSEEALSLFETSEPEELALRISFIDHLNDADTPFFSLDQLAMMADEFASYIECNRDYLVQIGHPERQFPGPLWIDTRLRSVYPVKRPLWIEHDTATDLLNYGFTAPTGETWTSIPADTIRIQTMDGIEAHRHGDRVYLENGEIHSVITHESADPIDSLIPSDLERLVNLRGKVLMVKVEILKLLARAARGGDAEGLWDGCWKILTEHLSRDEMEFLIEMDRRRYSGYDPRYEQVDERDCMYDAGGITSILAVVGHYEQEIALGTYATTRDVLEDAVVQDPVRSPRFIFKGYFGMRQKGQGDVVAQAYGQFRAKEGAAERFRVDYRKRLNVALVQDWTGDYTADPGADLSVPSEEFWHSEDYRSVRLNGSYYDLTPLQALAIRALHAAWMGGERSVSTSRWLSLISDLDEDYYPDKISDIFRSNDRNRELYRCPKKGIFSLKLDPNR